VAAASSDLCGTCGERVCWRGRVGRRREPVCSRGGDSPLGSNIFLTPFDRRMHAEGFRLTRWADGFIGLCQTKVEAQRALAIAELCFRKALGVARPPQKTRLVHISRGFEFLGYKVKQGTGFRQPTHRRRSWSKPSPPRCCPP
jgi:hypothetical protein